MFALLFLIPSTADVDVANFRLQPAPVAAGITLPCSRGDACIRTRRPDYRVPDEPDPLARTSKQRAFAADGQQCGLIGDKYCTSKGRTIFRTDFSE